MDIPYIGPKKASILYFDDKIKNITMLKKAVKNKEVSLTNAQLIGIKYRMQLKKKIPRHIIDIMNDEVKKISNNAVIAGSYRRGEMFSGDIDILFHDDVDAKYINEQLEMCGIVNLATYYSGSKKYSGIFKIEDHVCHVDFVFTNKRQFGAALLYFTGNKKFNTTMRTIAINKGYRLNEYGVVDHDTLHEFTNEKDIFTFLGMKYITPEKRGY